MSLLALNHHPQRGLLRAGQPVLTLKDAAMPQNPWRAGHKYRCAPEKLQVEGGMRGQDAVYTTSPALPIELLGLSAPATPVDRHGQWTTDGARIYG